MPVHHFKHNKHAERERERERDPSTHTHTNFQPWRRQELTFIVLQNTNSSTYPQLTVRVMTGASILLICYNTYNLRHSNMTDESCCGSWFFVKNLIREQRYVHIIPTLTRVVALSDLSYSVLRYNIMHGNKG